MRHDWNDCPQKSGILLKNVIDRLVQKNKNLDSLWIIGHSSGGLVVTYFAEEWDYSFPITVHAIAAPLNGTHKKINNCDGLKRNQYIFGNSINYFQWRTNYQLDGAFKKLKTDPQHVDFVNGDYILLPNKWKENRLGHNLSIQWVIQKLINRIKPV